MSGKQTQSKIIRKSNPKSIVWLWIVVVATVIPSLILGGFYILIGSVAVLLELLIGTTLIEEQNNRAHGKKKYKSEKDVDMMSPW